MRDNSVAVNIGGREFFIEDICISDSGEVSYNAYSKSEMSSEDLENLDKFVKILVSGGASGTHRGEDNSQAPSH